MVLRTFFNIDSTKKSQAWWMFILRRIGTANEGLNPKIRKQ